MSEYLVLGGHSPPEIESESHRRGRNEVERDPVPLSHSTVDVAPLNIKEAVPCRRRVKVVHLGGGSFRLKRLREPEFVSTRRAAQQAAQNQAAHGRLYDRAPLLETD